MQMILLSDSVFVFDLDDTLYSEREFESSGIRSVRNSLIQDGVSSEDLPEEHWLLKHRNNWINQLHDLAVVNQRFTRLQLLERYRQHSPEISMYPDAFRLIVRLVQKSALLALITNGRSSTQRNKIIALGIHDIIKTVCISDEIGAEKPDPKAYLEIQEKHPASSYVYIGDNPKIDFLAANYLGWTTICLLDRGYNIHRQYFSEKREFNPRFKINSFDEINII